MRILFCNFEYPPLGGGGGVATALLAQELAKRHDVTVLSSCTRGLPHEMVERRVRVVRVPVFFRNHQTVANLISMLAFIPNGIRVGKQILTHNQYDIINTHFVLPTGPVGEVLAHFAGIPNVLTLHGGDLYDPSKRLSPHRHPLLRLWIKYLLRRADVVVGQSQNTLQNMRRFYAAEISGVQIPLGIARPGLTIGSRESYGFRPDEVLLVTVGRLVDRKAVGQLVSMMTGLRKSRARLLIIGSGPQEALLKAQVAERQLGDSVSFLGEVEETEKFRLLRMSDCYVSTSQHEGFGLVYLEAMVCGLPIVCYDHGGQTDFLQDRVTGFVVPLNHLELFRKQCETLINSIGLRRKMGNNNKRRVGEFSIDKCALRYEFVFNQVLEARANGRKPVEMPVAQRASGPL